MDEMNKDLFSEHGSGYNIDLVLRNPKLRKQLEHEVWIVKRNGWETATKLRKNWADIACIMLSEMSEAEIKELERLDREYWIARKAEFNERMKKKRGDING